MPRHPKAKITAKPNKKKHHPNIKTKSIHHATSRPQTSRMSNRHMALFRPPGPWIFDTLSLEDRLPSLAQAYLGQLNWPLRRCTCLPRNRRRLCDYFLLFLHNLSGAQRAWCGSLFSKAFAYSFFGLGRRGIITLRERGDSVQSATMCFLFIVRVLPSIITLWHNTKSKKLRCHSRSTAAPPSALRVPRPTLYTQPC